MGGACFHLPPLTGKPALQSDTQVVSRLLLVSQVPKTPSATVLGQVPYPIRGMALSPVRKKTSIPF